MPAAPLSSTECSHKSWLEMSLCSGCSSPGTEVSPQGVSLRQQGSCQPRRPQDGQGLRLRGEEAPLSLTRRIRGRLPCSRSGGCCWPQSQTERAESSPGVPASLALRVPGASAGRLLISFQPSGCAAPASLGLLSTCEDVSPGVHCVSCASPVPGVGRMHPTRGGGSPEGPVPHQGGELEACCAGTIPGPASASPVWVWSQCS